jgi:hypothetical protein
MSSFTVDPGRLLMFLIDAFDHIETVQSEWKNGRRFIGKGCTPVFLKLVYVLKTT